MPAMRIVTAVVLLSFPAFALDLTLGEKVEGTSIIQAFSKVDTLRVRGPSGLNWSTKYVRDVSSAVDEKSRTRRNLHIDFGARFTTWDDVVNRMDELAKQLGATEAAREKWLTKFRGKPELGAQRWFPNFGIGGCETATITLRPIPGTKTWAVDLEFLIQSPEAPNPPASCRAATSR